MESDARSVAARGNGHHGEFRLSKSSAWRRLTNRGRPIVFASAFEAEARAWRAAVKAEFGNIVAATFNAPSARSKAEGLFRQPRSHAHG